MNESNSPIMALTKFFRNIDYDKIISNAETLLESMKKYSMKGSKEITRIMLELYFVMISNKTSKFNKLIIGAALSYQLLPNDLLNKEDYGVLAYFDNAAALYLAYRRVKKSVTPEIKQKVEETLENWAKSAEDFTIMKPAEERV